jgi:dynein heavy chain
MAKYCVIFNCSNDVNMKTIDKLLSGLCYTTSWICFDEINRFTTEIMSVIANQINQIKNAIVSGKQMFNFLGKKIHIKKGIGIFSTMNPIYLKRAKMT